MLTALVHREEGGWRLLDDLSTISDVLAGGELLWAHADITALRRHDIGVMAEEFDLHPLAVEDALNARQRPKLEKYDNHLFVVIHQLDEVEGQLEARQIACFAGKNYVLTLHDRSQRTIDEALARCGRLERVPGRGPSWVMHTLADAVVDDYQAIADGLEAEVEQLEDDLLTSPTTMSSTHVYSIKQRLARLRRYATPGSRALASFVESSEQGPNGHEAAAFFRDVLDHTLRITDQIRNVDDLLDALLELRRSEQANALNEVTKKLTGWAAIIAVPTFIASVYGMNFELVPKDGQLFGFFFALGLMAVSSISLYLGFKRRHWL